MKTISFYLLLFLFNICLYKKMITFDTYLIVLTMIWVTYFGKQFWEKKQ